MHRMRVNADVASLHTLRVEAPDGRSLPAMTHWGRPRNQLIAKGVVRSAGHGDTASRYLCPVASCGGSCRAWIGVTARKPSGTNACDRILDRVPVATFHPGERTALPAPFPQFSDAPLLATFLAVGEVAALVFRGNDAASRQPYQEVRIEAVR